MKSIVIFSLVLQFVTLALLAGMSLRLNEHAWRLPIISAGMNFLRLKIDQLTEELKKLKS